MDTTTPAAETNRAGGSEPFTADRFLRWALAALALGAAGVHFAFAPAHFDEDWAHGTFFLVMAWLQLGFAVGIIARPGRALLAAGAAVNLGAIVVWAVSRTVGIPFGPGSGEAESAAFPDVFCTVAEVAIVGIALAWLARPAVMARPVRSLQLASGVTAAIAIGALFSASLALTPAVAGDHDHGGGGHGETASADGHPHGGDAAATDGHAAGDGEVAAAWPAGESPCEQSGPPASPGQVSESAGGHSHRGPTPQEPLIQRERVQLAEQLEAARTVVDKYPTVAAAEAAGYHKSTEYVPCIGAHYTNVGLVAKFDPAAPSELLFDGTTPDAKIVGLSYLNHNKGGAPEGFAGPNDVWHQHNSNGGLCFGAAALVIGGEGMSEEECAAIGGQKRELVDIWMVHAWVVPGWDCSWGVFAGECPELGGRTGGTAWDAPDPEFEADLRGS